VRRRKEIASAMPVHCRGLHVSHLYQNHRRQASPRKKLRFRVARAPESVCTRESASSCATIKINTEVQYEQKQYEEKQYEETN
jgi:hypothetical protein